MLNTTFNVTLTAGMRGLAGMKTSSGFVLIATSADAASNKIFYYLDDGSSSNPTPTIIDTSLATTIFRGVALAP
jgi:hypothetical protein